MRKVLRVLCCLGLVAALAVGCGEKSPNGLKKKKVQRPAVESSLAQLSGPKAGDPIAVFDTDKGKIRVVLYPDAAPMAVDNFTTLAQEGFYNGKPFHRVLYGFVAQSGDVDGSGTSGRTIWKNKPYPKEVTSQLHHFPGALCAAFSPDDEVSGGSQFYFVQALPDSITEEMAAQMEAAGIAQEVRDAYAAVGGLPYLDYTDTVFGQVYEGMDVIDSIALVDTDENGKPTEDILIKTVTLETYQPE